MTDIVKKNFHTICTTGYIESFLSVKEEAKDICVFASTPAEVENVGEILKANCYFTLIAHEYLEPQELSSVKRQWNTPHSTDAMPVLGAVVVFILFFFFYLYVALPCGRKILI